MDIQLIALDMDGTLLDRDHLTIPPRNVAALRAAAQKGVKIAIASGRTLCLLREPAAVLGVVDYAILANGAGVADMRTGAWLSHIGIPEPQWRSILDILRRHGLPVETYADGMGYLARADLLGAEALGFSREFVEDYVSRVSVVPDVAEAVAGKTVEKLHVFYVPSEMRQALKLELAATGPLVFANGEPDNLELTAPGADKGKALQGLCAGLEIPPEAVMAFGDGDNDLEMLSWAGWSFAMENASPNAKAAARRLAAPNYDAGVGRAIERYVLDPCGA